MTFRIYIPVKNILHCLNSNMSHTIINCYFSIAFSIYLFAFDNFTSKKYISITLKLISLKHIHVLMGNGSTDKAQNAIPQKKRIEIWRILELHNSCLYYI